MTWHFGGGNDVFAKPDKLRHKRRCPKCGKLVLRDLYRGHQRRCLGAPIARALGWEL